MSLYQVLSWKNIFDCEEKLRPQFGMFLLQRAMKIEEVSFIHNMLSRNTVWMDCEKHLCVSHGSSIIHRLPIDYP